MAAASEKRYKAHRLIEEAEEDFEAAQGLDEENEVKKKASRACEDAFHALVETVDVVLISHGKQVPRSHEERREMLHDIGRNDLELLYGAAKDVLHTEGYYEQHVLKGSQRRLIDRIRAVIEKELSP
ncbi:MAG: hypothetical protein MAG715_00498 [Methanonatronarchaeales archaeon]|nr:hypothetical protein [Methanonatronarchaeales archaeon]